MHPGYRQLTVDKYVSSLSLLSQFVGAIMNRPWADNIRSYVLY